LAEAGLGEPLLAPPVGLKENEGQPMSVKEEIRLKAELRAASVLLAALMRQTEAQDLRRVFENAVVRETAHMLERGARNEAIRAFEDAAGEWSIRSHRNDRDDLRRDAQESISGRGPRQKTH
jgi:hypothetical protein